MAKKLSAASMFDTLEVDLWGSEYTLRQITRSVAEKMVEAQTTAAELQAKTIDGEDTDPGEVATSLIRVIDIVLAPVGDARPAGDVLTELWEADELGLDWLTAFSQAIQEEANNLRRPTSARQTRG